MAVVHTAKCGSVAIKVLEKSDGRFRIKFKQRGKWLEESGNDLPKMKRRAFEIAKAQHDGILDLASLSDQEREVCVFCVRNRLTVETIRGLMEERGVSLGVTPFKDVVVSFLAVKEAEQGRSVRHLDGLKADLKEAVSHFDDWTIGRITARDIESWIGGRSVGPQRHNNLRQHLVALFRWARSREMLPDATTQAERSLKRKVPKTSVSFFKPDDLTLMLSKVRGIYRAWLCVAAWAGVRSHEMFPVPRSNKSPLDWSDVDLTRKIIRVRPETAKMNKGRIIPMCDRLVEELKALRPASGTGRVGCLENAHNRETKRLAKACGMDSWDSNALRHSFGVYRTAVVGSVGQTALEMGNSESVCKDRYWEAVTKDEGEAWFRAVQGS